jgi:hypothetical protein
MKKAIYYSYPFAAGFFDKDDLETRFYFDRAIDAAFQPFVLVLYIIMALVSFLTSFKKIRIIKN